MEVVESTSPCSLLLDCCHEQEWRCIWSGVGTTAEVSLPQPEKKKKIPVVSTRFYNDDSQSPSPPGCVAHY
ncbi:hypothetical protein NDU88_005121 [Pleurodeles waltl]|uniref:Uncharacterized protein n=1 Tax=Pleurodeles waltl TaxID=8319 RepID=A0AAV7UH49_PLEWA|nr:hypothetical protein NDU88_005121 [Pleurodeles waltl]